MHIHPHECSHSVYTHSTENNITTNQIYVLLPAYNTHNTHMYICICMCKSICVSSTQAHIFHESVREEYAIVVVMYADNRLQWD